MTIKKNDFIGRLKVRITEMYEVYVLLPKGIRLRVRLDDGFRVHEMLRSHPTDRGVPQMASIENGAMISVFPCADKRYRLKVIGTQYIEQ